jgi:hypothetical protein
VVPPRIGRGADGVHRKTRNRYMIGMTMPTIGVVRNHNLRSMASNDFDELLPDGARWRVSEMLVVVSEQINVGDAEDRGRFAQLRLTPSR